MIKGQLTDTDRTEIVKYRLEKAYRTYNEAIGSIENGYVETAANRFIPMLLTMLFLLYSFLTSMKLALIMA